MVALTRLVDVTVGAATASLAAGSGGGGVDPALPLQLLEDAFDATTVDRCGAVWAVLERHQDALATIVNAQPRYRMPLLRIATSLTRRLSRVEHTVLLGRVLLALAYMFPLNDRSGVNLMGHLNGDNVTRYEGDVEDETLIASAAKWAAGPTSPPAQPPLALPAPWSPGSAAQSTACVDHLRAALAGCGDVAAVSGAAAKDSPAFHRTFWRLQLYANAPGKALSSAEAWGLFLATARIVLHALELAMGARAPSSAAAAMAAIPPSLAAACGCPAPAVATGSGGAGGPVPAQTSGMPSRLWPAGAGSGAGVGVGFGAARPPVREEGEEGEEARTPVAGGRPGAVAPPRGGPLPLPAPAPGSRGGAAVGMAPPSQATGKAYGAAGSAAAAAAPVAVAVTAAGAAHRFLTHPLGLADADLAAAPLPPPAAGDWGRWLRAHHARLPAAAVTADGARTAVHGDGGGDGGGGVDEGEFFAAKYLTSPQLLATQLQDASLRRHVLLQVVILCQYLLHQRTEAEAYAAVEAERKRAGPAGAATAPPLPHKPREAFPVPLPVQVDLVPLQALAYALLCASGPDGPAFARGVAVALHRETVWRNWKSRNAPEFERTLPAAVSAAGDDGEASGGVGSKRSAAQAGLGGGGMMRSTKRFRGGLMAAGRRPLDWASKGLHTDLWRVAADPGRAPVRISDDYGAAMAVAFDPDNGIEAEFWPSTNPVFCWRAYRCIAMERLGAFTDVTKPFVDLACQVFSLSRPAPPTAPAPATGDLSDAEMGGVEPGADSGTGAAEEGEGAPDDNGMEAHTPAGSPLNGGGEVDGDGDGGPSASPVEEGADTTTAAAGEGEGEGDADEGAVGAEAGEEEEAGEL